MAYSDNFPATRPVFMADFANGGKIDPRATFTRSDTPPTYAAPSAVHYWSNEKHLSSENLLLDSKTGTGNWTAGYVGGGVTPTVTANHAAAPDGTANQATRVQLSLNGNTGTGDYSRYYQNYNVASGTSATFAVWLKSTDGSSSYTAQLISPAGTGTAVTVTGAWQQFTVTASSAGNITYGVRLVGGQTPTNSDTADILMWGANLSTTGQTVLSETTTSIHRQYAPTLKSVATAGQPRFEYDPATDGQSAAKGILIEGQSQNLFAYSDDFANQWTKTRTLASESAAVGPTGALDADLIYADGTAADSHFLYSSCTVTAASHTFSVYAKFAGVQYIQLQHRVTGAGSAQFDLVNGTYVAYNATGAMEPVGNGWYRCSVTETQSAGTAFARIWLMGGSGVGDYNWDGDSYSGVLLYGAQYEQNSFPSSLISSNGSATTRAAEQLSVATAAIG